MKTKETDLAVPAVTTEERNWAMIAHLSVLLNMVTGFLGVLAALVIYFVYRDRSKYVADHAMQAFIFQLICWGGGGILLGIAWSIVGILSLLIVGLILIPFALIFSALVGLMPIASLIYGVVGGLKVNRGEDFKYWLVGEWIYPTRKTEIQKKS